MKNNTKYTTYAINFLFVLLLFVEAKAQDNQQPATIQYIETYAPLAIKEMARTGFPASIKIAQGIIETDAGRSALVQKSNNHFGLKCKSNWTGEKVYHDDDEQGECFRKYNNADESYLDHSDYLKSQSRYTFLFSYDPNDYDSWAWGLKKAGYATSPIYAQTLIKNIEKYNLNQLNNIKEDTDSSSLAAYFNALENNLIAQPIAKLEQKNYKPEEVKKTSTGKRIEDKSSIVITKSQKYPSGIFKINGLKVIYANSGTSLLSIAKKHHLQLSGILSWNELRSENTILEEDQLIYLQKKKKTGKESFYIVQTDENLLDVSQKVGVQLSSIMSLNKLKQGMTPAVGEKISLKKSVKERPALANNSGLKEGKNSIALHVVKQGESLYTIAKKYKVSIDSIKQANSMDQDDLQVGQTLKILNLGR
jgi:LysM repeat protein